uniref:Uncharacterized protein n=1 Tax=Anopheles atroparvus TaxID=41427 RepID=A0AAG5DQ38_ANOAO
MNVSAVDDQRFQFTTTSDALANTIMATGTPLIANEWPSIYHNSPAALRTSGEATAVNEYPIQLLSEEAAAGIGNSAYVGGTRDSAGDALEIFPAVSSEIHEPFMNIPARGNNVSQQLSTIETLTATTHDGTVSKVMNPQNHLEYNPRKPFCSKTDETSRRMSNIADRTVQSTKRQVDINIQLPSTAPKHKNVAMQKHNILHIHPQFKRNRSLANIKPLQLSFACNEQATLYKVVCPGKIKGVQTRSGRLSKPPQALADGFVCRVTKDDHHRQQPSREVNTFHDVHFHLDENKENPEKHMAKLAPTTARRKAKVQPQYQCGTCHKIYLGRRMARHLRAYPKHVTLDKLDTCETKPDAMDSTPATSALPSFKPALHDPSLSPPTQLYRLLVELVTAPQTESNQRAVLLGEISQ